MTILPPEDISEVLKRKKLPQMTREEYVKMMKMKGFHFDKEQTNV